MKQISALFAAAVMTAMMAPAISMPQDQTSRPDLANPFADGAVAFNLLASACTSDGFTEEGGVVVAISASDVKKLGDGDLEAGMKKLALDSAALKAELAKAWQAFTADVTSTDLDGIKPSEKAITSLKTHLDEFTAAETTTTGVHFAIAQDGISKPTPGCRP